MGGTGKNLKIKIYPTCFEKVFFRKNSLRGLQWYIFPLHILYGIGEKNVCNLPDGETPLINTRQKCENCYGIDKQLQIYNLLAMTVTKFNATLQKCNDIQCKN